MCTPYDHKHNHYHSPNPNYNPMTETGKLEHGIIPTNNPAIKLFDMQLNTKITPDHAELLPLVELDYHNRIKQDEEFNTLEELQQEYPRTTCEPHPNKYIHGPGLYRNKSIHQNYEITIPEPNDIKVLNFLNNPLEAFRMQDEEMDDDLFDEEDPSGLNIGNINIKTESMDIE